MLILTLGTGSHTDASDFKAGDWWVRPTQNLVERTDEVRNLEARSMGVLVCLAKYAPGVVSKERLLNEVWEGAFVGEDAIAHAVWELRKAFGDSAREPSYIQTVPRKGYRLIAEVLRPQGAPLPMEGVRIDHFDLGEELGRGSMGVVFQAVDRRLDRTVAIKFLSAELTQDAKACRRFEREARLAASLEHPNLATVHEVGETSQGYRYLVGSFYRGGSLKDRLAEGPLPADEAVRLVRQLIAGLGAAHRRDVIHRDIKPANLLLDEHGTLKICDFGIAKLLGATDLTRTGVTPGTPAYKSPEQAAGRAVDHRTDLWAAGVVLYELLTGKRPFRGEGEHAVVHSIRSSDPELQAIPEALRRFMDKALSKDPSERFQDAEEMVAGLDLAVGEGNLGPSTANRSWHQAALAGAATVFVASVWWTSQMSDTTVPSHSTPPLERQDLVKSEATSSLVSNPEGEYRLTKARQLSLRGHHTSTKVEELLREALKLMPQSAKAKAQLAFFLTERFGMTNRDEARREALRLIAEVSESQTGSGLAQAALARLALMEGRDLNQAEDLARGAVQLEEACDVDGDCDLGYLVLGEVLRAKNKTDDAEVVLKSCLDYGEGRIRCNLSLAHLYQRLNRGTEAEATYKQVLDLDESQAVALSGLADFYMKAERFKEALESLGKLQKVSPNPRALLLIGYGQYRSELWELAIQTYRQADLAFQQEENVRLPTPLMGIGDVYLEIGEGTLAEKEYSRALEIFEQESRPGIRRQGQYAVCLAKLGRIHEAVSKIEALLKNPEYADVEDLKVHAARIYALKRDDEKLFTIAAEWVRAGGEPERLLDEDPAFIPYRDNPDYRRILTPELILPT